MKQRNDCYCRQLIQIGYSSFSNMPEVVRVEKSDEEGAHVLNDGIFSLN